MLQEKLVGQWHELVQHLTPEERARLGNAKFLFDPDNRTLGYFSRPKTTTDDAKLLLSMGGIRLVFWISSAYELSLLPGREGWAGSYFTLLRRELPKFLGGAQSLPGPFEAAGVTADATKGDGVVGAVSSEEIFRFLLAHELGHLVYQPSPGVRDSLEASRAEETAADRFALELLQRSGRTPAGATIFLIAYMVIFEKSPHVPPGTHPHTLVRLKAINSYVKQHLQDYPLTAYERGRVLEGVRVSRSMVAAIAANPDFWSELDETARTISVEDLRFR